MRPSDRPSDWRPDGRRSSTGRGSLPPSWLRVRRLIKMVPPLGISREGKKDIQFLGFLHMQNYFCRWPFSKRDRRQENEIAGRSHIVQYVCQGIEAWTRFGLTPSLLLITAWRSTSRRTRRRIRWSTLRTRRTTLGWRRASATSCKYQGGVSQQVWVREPDRGEEGRRRMARESSSFAGTQCTAWVRKPPPSVPIFPTFI